NNLPVLDRLAGLPAPAGSPPPLYAGLQVEVKGPSGSTLAAIAGGVRMRRSVGTRLLDQYEDAQTRRLRAAAAQLESSQQVSMVARGVTLLLVRSEMT